MSLDTIITPDLAKNIQLFFVPVYLIFIFIEMLAIKFFNASGSRDAKEIALNISIGIASVPINAMAKTLTLGALFWAQQYQINVISITIFSAIICFVLDDLRFYIHHRICHRFRWQWGMHVTHHSSERLSLAVALRQGWTKHFTGTMMLKVPLVLIGFNPFLIIVCGVLNASYQFFLHTESIKKLPRWYEFIFNTPSHHRAHHGKNPQYLDCNYAGTLIIWDRMFGSFVEEDKNEFPNYGLVEPMQTYNPFKIIFSEYIRIFKDILIPGLTIKQRFLYLFGPPGWSHDGSRLMSTDIKRIHLESQKS